MIDLTCPHCNQELHIKEKHAGKSGRCNKCGGAIVVPSLPPVENLSNGPMALPINTSTTPVSQKHKVPVALVILGWTFFLFAMILVFVGELEVAPRWYAFVPFAISVALVIIDCFARKIPKGRIVLWAIACIFLYVVAFPLYLFRRTNTHNLVAIPASIMFGVFVFVVGFLIGLSNSGSDSFDDERQPEIATKSAQKTKQNESNKFNMEQTADIQEEGNAQITDEDNVGAKNSNKDKKADIPVAEIEKNMM